MNQEIKTIAFCGAGQFGFAVLKHLERKFSGNPEISLLVYDIEPRILDGLEQSKTHPFISGAENTVTEKVRVVRSVEELVQQADLIVLAVNSPGLKDVFEKIRSTGRQDLAMVNVAKALDDQSRTYSQNAAEALAGVSYRYAALVGGSIAEDLMNGNPLGMTIASKDAEFAEQMAELFGNEYLKVYPETDIVGVELASALKNIVSLAGGLVEGIGYSYGSVTYMITKTAQELADFAVAAYGAKAETFGMYTQHWGNDMWMSATGNTRNHRFGKLVGAGKTAEEAFAEMNTKTVESLFSLTGIANNPAFLKLKIVPALYRIFISKEANPESFKALITANKF